MAEAKPQVSLAVLLLTVAAVAVALELMFQVPNDAARIVLVGLVPIASLFAITGLLYGSPTMRTFCVGALVPLGMMLVFVTINLPEVMLPAHSITGGGRPGTYFLLAQVSTCLGSGFLASIAFGYLCVWLRWLIERPRPPEPGP